MARSTTRRLSTGSAPGMPEHTGQQWVLGAPPNAAEQAQKSLVRVASSTCTSSPTTIS